jgi:hypothetical protein
LSALSSLASAAASVATDPYLPQVVYLVNRLDAAESGGSSGGSSSGVGLKYLVKPLGWYVTVRERPWLIPVLAGVVLGLPFLLGYKMGRR